MESRGSWRTIAIGSKGREAAALRKALFAIVLVGASFAGGAVVNGPGLRWAQAMLLSGSESDDSETTADAAEPKVEDSSPSNPAARTLLPPLNVDVPAKPLSQARVQVVARDVVPGAVGAAAATPEPKAPAPPEPSSPELPPVAKKDDADSSPPKDLALALVDGAPAAEMPRALESPTAAKDADELKEAKPSSVPWADAPGSAPASAVPPRPPGQPAPNTAAGTFAPSAGAWADLRRKMVSLGVTRYGVEGEPAGRVRFHCLIPLAGRRAVAQQFEADGDDEFQAAEAALRRVMLWRATEEQEP